MRDEERYQHTKRKQAIREKYDLSQKQFYELTPQIVKQLDACKSEEARRILLGKSK